MKCQILLKTALVKGTYIQRYESREKSNISRHTCGKLLV